MIDDTKDADTDEFKKVTEIQDKISTKVAEALTESIRNKGYTKGYITEVLNKYDAKKLEDLKANDLPNFKKELEI